MARKKVRKAKPKAGISEQELTKGQIRKLNALRKSLGEEIADKAFQQWLDKTGGGQVEKEDKNAKLIAETLAPLVQQKKLRIPRGGYLVTRGRGRVIVSRPEAG